MKTQKLNENILSHLLVLNVTEKLILEIHIFSLLKELYNFILLQSMHTDTCTYLAYNCIIITDYRLECYLYLRIIIRCETIMGNLALVM